MSEESFKSIDIDLQGVERLTAQLRIEQAFAEAAESIVKVLKVATIQELEALVKALCQIAQAEQDFRTNYRPTGGL